MENKVRDIKQQCSAYRRSQRIFCVEKKKKNSKFAGTECKIKFTSGHNFMSYYWLFESGFAIIITVIIIIFVVDVVYLFQ